MGISYVDPRNKIFSLFSGNVWLFVITLSKRVHVQ